ncbi:MAG TPA: aminotransferase class I/II-fold pyridoxal phosphate-dependent enzyme [Roseiflexaceae bacterium]|nr:aminotransferase class I/II-fold pyridoxal phosphate-dependent enzyme [Roseiflexaceae bacterium]HMP40739.1 aminotransferase class I/II-fold pyridoxal phosphate-dependent enzyme [Roseiflexaceae bacterium]
MERLAKRVAGFGTSIFTEITALAVQLNAVNLGQGFPDFAGPEFVKQAAAAAIAADHNQYAAAPGLPRLRQAVAAQWQRDHGHEIDWASEVTVTSGATEALCDAMLALLNPGDAALFFEPAYDAYLPDVTLAGGVAVPVRLHPPDPQAAAGGMGRRSDAWWFEPQELHDAFARRPKVLLLNSPHNPTGKVFDRAELELIAALCREYDVVAVTDEVYDRLTFDGTVHIPLATLPDMWQRTLTLNSAGKTFSVTGWKIGYAVGPAHLNHALRQAHQWVTFATATPLQDATAAAIEAAATNGYYQQFQAEYDERRRLLADVLDEAGLPRLPCQGSYFLSADISALGYTDDRAFCRYLVTEVGVAAIPTSVFYVEPTDAPPLARFCFAKHLTTIAAAGERLRQLR